MELGLTQEELAIPGNTVANISNIENGKQFAGKATRVKIEAMIGPVDWISTGFSGIDRDGAEKNGAEGVILCLSEHIYGNNVDPSEKIKYIKRVLEVFEEDLAKQLLT